MTVALAADLMTARNPTVEAALAADWEWSDDFAFWAAGAVRR